MDKELTLEKIYEHIKKFNVPQFYLEGNRFSDNSRVSIWTIWKWQKSETFSYIHI